MRDDTSGANGSNDDDDDNNYDKNPFLDMQVDELHDISRTANVVTSIPASNNNSSCRRRRPSAIRHWGLPTFSDQIDRGINQYTFQDSVTVYINYRQHSTGSDLWDSALVLSHALGRLEFSSKYIQEFYSNTNIPSVASSLTTATTSTISEVDHKHDNKNAFNNITIVELGSGTGLVGLWLARLGAKHVVLSDLPENIALIQKNIEYNQLDNVTSTLALDWTLPIPSSSLSLLQNVQLIVGSDLFLPFDKQLLYHLVQTLVTLFRHCQQNGPIQAIFCYEERFDCSEFFQHAEQSNLFVEIIPNLYLHPNYQDPDIIHMLRITPMK